MIAWFDRHLRAPATTRRPSGPRVSHQRSGGTSALASKFHVVGFQQAASVNENSTFEAWQATTVTVSETTIFSRRGGAGPPLLLLHGFPEPHLMWHAVAPMLAEAFTVICADLRGYGASGKPASSTDHAPYAKRAMARDMIELMGALGFARLLSPATIAAAA